MPEGKESGEGAWKVLFRDRRSRRAGIGLVSGLLSSVVLIATLHNVWLGVGLGALIGALYALTTGSAPFAYAESAFTAGSLAVPLWAIISLILLPAFAGAGPQWSAEGMRALFPSIGWLVALRRQRWTDSTSPERCRLPHAGT